MIVQRGTSGRDYLVAYGEDVVLQALGDNDTLVDNGYATSLEGGAGDDLYQVLHPGSTIAEAGNAGEDTVWLYTPEAFVLPDNVENVEFFSESSTDATGNSLDNLIVGNSGVNELIGLDGDDTIRAEGGDDRIEGGSGDDFLDGGGGDSTLSTGSGRDMIYVTLESGHHVVEDFSVADDRIQVRGFWDYTLSQVGEDTLVRFSDYVTVLLQGVDADAVTDLNFDLAPRPGPHTLVGTDGVESLYGWADGDEAYGLDGGDYFGDHDGDWSRFFGGKGDDTFEVDNPLDEVIELEDEGRDLVWLSFNGPYTLAENVEDINVMGAAEITANASDNAVQGSGGDDVLYGLGGDDTIRAVFGSDYIDGGEGDDFLDGGGGQSTLVGGAGSDRIFVEWESGNHVVQDFDVGEDAFEVWSFKNFSELQQVGEDTLVVFSDSTNVLLEGVAPDDLTSRNFNFVQAGTAAPETLTGGAYSDTIDGEGGADRLSGKGGQDEMSGGAGADSLKGHTGADVLRGGAQGDVLIGGAGQDLLIGGRGGDTYLFNSLSSSRTDAADKIWGFDAAGGDVVDLSAIDADLASEEDDAFAFVADFTGNAAEAVASYDELRRQTTVSLDADGDGQADFTLLFRGEVGTDAGWVL